jgi:hypothetical protein
MLEPHEFVRNLAVRLPALLGQLALQLPSEHTSYLLRALPVGVRISITVLLIAGTAWLCGTIRRRAPALSWIALGTLLSLLPLLAVESGARLLVLPCAGSSLLVAALVARLATRSMPSRVLAGLVVGVQGLCAGVSAALASAALERTAARAQDSVFASDVNPPDARARCFVILNTRDWVSFHSAPFMLAAEHGGFPRCWFVLAASRGRVEVERPTGDVIELHALDGTLLDVLGRQLAIRPLALPSEAFLQLQPRLRVRVLETSSAGPVHAQFRSSFLLDAPEVTYIAWQGDRLRNTSLPAIGESRIIP